MDDVVNVAWTFLKLAPIYLFVGWIAAVTHHALFRPRDSDRAFYATLYLMAWPAVIPATLIYHGIKRGNLEQYCSPIYWGEKLANRRERKAHALNMMSKDRVANCTCEDCRELGIPKEDPSTRFPQWWQAPYQNGSSTNAAPPPSSVPYPGMPAPPSNQWGTPSVVKRTT